MTVPAQCLVVPLRAMLATPVAAQSTSGPVLTEKPQYQAIDQGQVREQFLINLKRVAAGELPRATAADRRHAEQQLTAGKNANLTVKSLAAPQRSWLALCRAWMRFIPVAYPHLPPDWAATEPLHLRIHQLSKA